MAHYKATEELRPDAVRQNRDSLPTQLHGTEPLGYIFTKIKTATTFYAQPSGIPLTEDAVKKKEETSKHQHRGKTPSGRYTFFAHGAGQGEARSKKEETSKQIDPIN